MRTKSRAEAEINYPSLTFSCEAKRISCYFSFRNYETARACLKNHSRNLHALETSQLIFTKYLYFIEQYDQIQEETIYGTEHVLFSV